MVGIIPDACQLPPSLQKTEQHVLRGAGGPGSMRRRHSNCSPASGRDQDVPLTRVGDPANGFSSCSRGAGESGGPGLGYPPGRAAPRPTRGWAGRGRRAAPAHRAGVPPSCGLRSGTWRNGSRVRGVARAGTHASPIASSSIVKPRGECGPVVADGHHRGARAGPFSREQRPVDVLRTRIGEGGTGGREPSVWPVITPTGAKTPPSGPHRRDLNGCPGPVRPRRCGRDGQPGAPGPVAGISVKLRSVVLSAALPAWPSPPFCSSWKRHPMGGQGRGEMGCGSIRPGWVRRVSSGLDLRSPRRGRARSPRDNGHVTRCGRRPGGSRREGSPGHVGRCPRWM